MSNCLYHFKSATLFITISGKIPEQIFYSPLPGATVSFILVNEQRIFKKEEKQRKIRFTLLIHAGKVQRVAVGDAQ